uniref:Retrovirus-related Pol polyprotein from transposon 17.6 n=1 Tax=Cajanus cajan TaxID=3821 RepID=A0A151U8J1_CAJCA|nr:Retrovirus-related Pol polyprotein from transposon 17.6 [Cajanus cajan]
MKSPTTLKEVQKLAERLTSLSRFLPCLAEIVGPILLLLKKTERFKWTQGCEEAFQQFKNRLGMPPVLCKPVVDADMIIYLSVSDSSISAVMMQENQGQQLIYFISRTLQDAERRYQLLEKVALGLVYAARRLRQYFQSHKVVVRTDCPIAKVLRKPEIAGRMMAWSVELSEFDISFEPRGPIKSQHLVDFVNELTPPGSFEDQPWILHVDGSSNAQGSGAGIILANPSGITIEQSLRFGFRASNNQAEYEALIAGLRLATEMNVKKVICWTDSKVVAEQVNDNFQVKDANLLQYYHLFRKLKDDFTEVQIRHIPRSNNERADQLARLASTRKPGQLRTTIHLEVPSPSVAVECMAAEVEVPSWLTPIRNFILQGELPTDSVEARKLRTQAAREIHEGICGSHSGGRTLAAKVSRAGYYWPTLKGDCAEFVKRCIQCQRHGNLIHASAAELHSISSPWPFALWGIDVLGPFPMARGQVKFLLVAVDYFTKWIEAEPLACISAANVQKFVWKNIITQVLWAYRCTPQSTTKETPFRLTYGADAMIPVEVGEPSFRRQHFQEDSNDTSLRAELDVLEEVRDNSQVVAEACKQRMSRRFNSNLKPRTFHDGDLVWRATGSARRNPSEGKLAANWDGPFRVRHALHNGAYKLEELSGKVLPRTWNSTHLKTYYS